MTGRGLVSLSARNDAVLRGLPPLYDASRDSATFDDYGGHLLLALTLIATTSGAVAVCEMAREMALERGRYWRDRWPEYRSVLNADTVMQAVIATFASERLGLETRSVRDELKRTIGAYRTADLLYFDPSLEPVPGDVPHDCRCGRANVRGSERCAGCNAGLEFQSRFEIWYYALTSAYFCEQCGIDLPVTFASVLRRLAELRPYPTPGGRGYYHAIYAATHVIYTLNGYGTYMLPPAWLSEERAFLRGSVGWAMAQGEPDTIGELLDSLSALGIPDEDPQVRTGRRVLLDCQLPDGSWGHDAGDRYAYFHTIWAAIDGLRDHRWHGSPVFSPDVRRTLDFLQRYPST